MKQLQEYHMRLSSSSKTKPTTDWSGRRVVVFSTVLRNTALRKVLSEYLPNGEVIYCDGF